MRVFRYGKFVPTPGEDIPIFKEPAPSDIPGPLEEEWKRRQEAASQTPIKLSPPPESGPGLAPLALLAGALFLL